MKTRDFFFNLPEELVAQTPREERGNDRLMAVWRKTQKIEHRVISDLPELLPQNSLLVFNDSRVRKARIYGKKNDGENKESEFLLIEKANDYEWNALCKKAKQKKTGSVYLFEDKAEAEIIRGNNEFVTLRFNKIIDDNYLDKYGHIPLPPYIKRKDNEIDAARYQNIYAKMHGSIASPTAGLHFTDELLTRLGECGIETAFITLHVGLGTFLPVRSENVEEHKMHEECYSINAECAEKINRAVFEKRALTACGTTSLRCLESAAVEKKSAYQVQSGEGKTRAFIYPGYNFKIVSNLFTNFHTPCSTLLMLVCALGGKDFIFKAYEEAVRERYRFFSYGDAMLVL